MHRGLHPDQVLADPGRGSSRRQLLAAGGAGALGLALANVPGASARGLLGRNDFVIQEALNVAATVEVLTTVLTNIALQKVTLPQAGIDTVSAASREELDHFQVLTQQFGARPATKKIWIPDGVFASPTSLFTTVVVGEQICVNLYLVLTTIFAEAGEVFLTRASAELVGNESVHRALARQALNLQPNDRAFAKYNQPDQADGPGSGMPGFTTPQGAIQQLEGAGVGFGKQGATPGTFYDFDQISPMTPNPSFVNTLEPH